MLLILNISALARPITPLSIIDCDDMFNVEVTPIYSPEDKREFDTTGDYNRGFDCPESFKNANELMDWFKDKYIPRVYRNIVLRMFLEFKNREL